MNELWNKKEKGEFIGENMDPVLFQVENAVKDVMFEKREAE